MILTRIGGTAAGLTLAAMLLAHLSPGCGGGSGNPGGGGDFETLESGKQRIANPDVVLGDLEALVAGNTAFACDLYQQLRGEDGNLFYSPFSISIALAMTYAGARGQTEQEMADTLRFTLSQDHLHPAFNALDLALMSREEAEPDADDGFKLRIANSIWGQLGESFAQSFLDTLAESYGSGLNLLDFMADPERCRLTINDWVLDETQGKIEDLLPQGSIGSETRLVLTNAIYFKAAWNAPFEEQNTRHEDFHLPDGGTVTVDMMHQVENLPYSEGDGYQAVALPYDGNQLDMVVIVPEEGNLEAFEAALSPERIAGITGDFASRLVTLSLPKFTYEDETDLAGTLATMGMPTAFTPAADFTGIRERGELMITGVFHKAFVGVNEAGTEAAAATAVVVGETSVPQTATVTVDRPFLFLIRDIPTGTILFVGRVVDPTA